MFVFCVCMCVCSCLFVFVLVVVFLFFFVKSFFQLPQKCVSLLWLLKNPLFCVHWSIYKIIVYRLLKCFFFGFSIYLNRFLYATIVGLKSTEIFNIWSETKNNWKIKFIHRNFNHFEYGIINLIVIFLLAKLSFFLWVFLNLLEISIWWLLSKSFTLKFCNKYKPIIVQLATLTLTRQKEFFYFR